MSEAQLTAEDVIALLKLSPHPEGGFYRQTFCDAPIFGGRAASTLIYFLLRRGQISNWHRIDAAEVWHYYAGAPFELSLSPDGQTVSRHILGIDLLAGERPQAVVRPGDWQSARTLGNWTLVGCTVAPGFEFEKFELAPFDWQPLQQ